MQEPAENSNDGTSKAVQSLTTPNRIVWLEYLLIISASVVVAQHVLDDAFLDIPISYAWWVSNIYAQAGQWPVPIFVMLSGYFLLDPAKNHTLISFYKKRAARILVPLIFWSVFYIAFSVIQEHLAGYPSGWKDFIMPVLKGEPYHHLWYLYMLVGLLLFTPFIKNMVAGSTKRELMFACGLLFLFAMLVDAANYFYYDYYNPVSHGSLFITWFLSYLGYFLAGHLLGRVIDVKIGLFSLVVILVGSIALTALGVYILTERYTYNQAEYMSSFLSPTVVAMSLAVFLIAKKVLPRIPHVRIIAGLSSSALGVYVMHPFFIYCLNEIGFSANKFDPIIGIPLVTLCVFLIALAFAEAIKRIPYIRRII